jgi:hypothetical protein
MNFTVRTPFVPFTNVTRIAATLALALTAGLAQAGEVTVAAEIDGFVSTKTRAEVRAETQIAVARGLVARSEADFDRLAQVAPSSMLSRAQVLAEAAEARRLGLIAHGDLAAPEATPEQLERIRLAGQRVLMLMASR